jgi:Eco57I restriction-modification methylase
MANARDERHLFGQHYTPHHVARLLAALAIRSSGDLVLDPSCGDGRLLEAALTLKRELAFNDSVSSNFPDQVFGIERSLAAVRTAQDTGASVTESDFFEIVPGAEFGSSPPFPVAFDVLIGNPPYIRQELIGSNGKQRIEAQLARDRARFTAVFWPRWSRRSDIYVYFFAHSIGFLKNQGRLVYLTASSWLDTGYGSALRAFLLENFRVVAVVESSAESFFADASINTCITVLEREPNREAREKNPIRFVRFNRSLDQILDEYRLGSESCPEWHLANDILCANFSSVFPSYRIRCVAQSDLSGSKTGIVKPHDSSVPGWGKYLRADEVFFKILEQGRSHLLCLSELANVRFGVKTGANEFFYFKDDGEETNGKKQTLKRHKQNDNRTYKDEREARRLLELGTVASVRRGITTGANEFFYLNKANQSETGEAEHNHRPTEPGSADRRLTTVRDSAGRVLELESELLSPVIFSLKEITSIELERVNTRRLLFNCSLTPGELEGTHALNYIRAGEQAGFHLRPTCSNRDPWYSAARGMEPAPLIFPSKVGERWLVALNRAQVYEDKKLYGVFPRQGVSNLVLAALLNSTWARYYAELTCRQMTGAQAIADIDVVVAEQILLPDPLSLPEAITENLETALIQLCRRPVLSFFEEINQSDRRRLDLLTLEAIGIREESERDAVLNYLYCSLAELIKARISK